MKLLLPHKCDTQKIYQWTHNCNLYANIRRTFLLMAYCAGEIVLYLNKFSIHFFK